MLKQWPWNWGQCHFLINRDISVIWWDITTHPVWWFEKPEAKIILRRYDNSTMTSMSRSTFNRKLKNYIFAFVLTVIFAVSLLLLLLLLVLSRFGPRNIMVTLNRPIRLFHWRDFISSASWQHITIGWACLRVRKWRAESIVASMSTTITKS